MTFQPGRSFRVLAAIGDIALKNSDLATDLDDRTPRRRGKSATYPPMGN